MTLVLDEAGLALAAPDKARSIKVLPGVTDRVFRSVAFAAGGITVAIMVAVGLFLSLRASSALRVAGFSFLTQRAWAPERQVFGVGAVLFGTVTIALIALSISLPLSLGTALLLSEVVGGRLRSLLVTLVDLMAAVPSIVFGLWGVYFLQAEIIPVSQWLSTTFAWIPIFAVTNADGSAATDASAFTSSALISPTRESPRNTRPE